MIRKTATAPCWDSRSVIWFVSDATGICTPQLWVGYLNAT
jgi:hypothetical protein